MTLYWGHSALCGPWRLVKLTSLQQSEPPVWPLLWKEVKGRRGSSESGILSPWGTGAGLLGTPWGESSDPCGILLHIHCPANAAKCLKRRESTNPLLIVLKALSQNHKYNFIDVSLVLRCIQNLNMDRMIPQKLYPTSTWWKRSNYWDVIWILDLKTCWASLTDLKQGPCPLCENRNNTC